MKKIPQPNWVTAVFQNAAVSIEFARKTTLAQLAEQLSALGEIHGKLLLPVQVRVAAPVIAPVNSLAALSLNKTQH
jgi:hypothetical protein